MNAHVCLLQLAIGAIFAPEVNVVAAREVPPLPSPQLVPARPPRSTAADRSYNMEAQLEPQAFLISNTWDGKPLDHHTKIHLEGKHEFVQLSIEAPFYDDAPPPQGKRGEAYFKLWDYEVVEAFFLNDEQQYLEVEFGPHGQHLLLLLSGQGNAIKHSMPVQYEASIDRDKATWKGVAQIPLYYFPPNITKFNAYAIHGPQTDRKYEALYEVSGPAPNFHRLEKFQPFPHKINTQLSQTWKTALEQSTTKTDEKVEKLTVGLSWDGKSEVALPANITLSSSGNDLKVEIEAGFYGDPAPPGGRPGEPFFKLWDYEVVECFLLNDADEYLELEFGPHGQHLMLLLSGTRNAIKHSLPLRYEWNILKEESPAKWKATAYIPETYLPPKVTRVNGYAIHGTGDNRVYETVYEVSGPQPDFHRLSKFGHINLKEILPANDRKEHSAIWQQAITESQM